MQTNNVNVITPDISWHDEINQTSSDLSTVSYMQDLCKLVIALDKPVVLAAHSMGGMIISQLSELIPDQVESLIYISGFLLKNGQCINDTASLMSGSLIQPNLRLSGDKKNILVPDSILRPGFYADCSEDDYLVAKSRILPQPVSTFSIPIRLSQQNFSSIPCTYIECLQDQAIPLTAQRSMYTDLGCDTVHSLDCSHSPFFSQAGALAKLLTGE